MAEEVIDIRHTRFSSLSRDKLGNIQLAHQIPVPLETETISGEDCGENPCV